MNRPFLVYVTLILFSVFSITGCSSTGAAGKNSPPGPPAPASKEFSVSRDAAVKASSISLQKLGYLVTDQNITAGTITAERFTTSPFAVDDTSAVKSNASSSPNPFLVFLSFILIFGLVFLIIDAASNPSSGTEKKQDQHDDVHHHYNTERNGTPAPVLSYKYVMTVRFTAVSDTVTNAEPVITMISMRNGAPTNSAAVRSSTLLNEFYQGLKIELKLKP